MKQEKLDQAWQALFEGQYEQASRLIQDLPESYSKWNLQAYLAVEKGEFTQARSYLAAYVQRAETERQMEQLHIGLHQQAYVEREAGDWSRALHLIKQEQEILEQYFPEDVLKRSVNRYEMGYLQYLLGDVSKGLVYMKESLTLAEQTDDTIAQATCYRALGEMQSSVADLQQALLLFEAAGDRIAAQEVQQLMTTLQNSPENDFS